MTLTPSRRIAAVWLLLVAATWFSSSSAHGAADHPLATRAVLVVAFVKARFVGLEFMELRAAPLPLRAIFEAWVVLACTALLALYWSAP